MQIIFLKGFFLTLSLNSSIGAQNIFILKQGIAKNHLFAVASLFFIYDLILISGGILGIGEFLAGNKILNYILGFCGICFTLFYAFLFFRQVFKKANKFDISNNVHFGLKRVFLISFAVTFFNPQVYLDTIFIIGSAALIFESLNEKLIFLIGALSASLLWFFGLTYGSMAARKFLLKPKVIKAIDIFSGLIMLFIAYSLFQFLLSLN